LPRYCERRETGIDSTLDQSLFGGANAVIEHLRRSDEAYDFLIGRMRNEISDNEANELRDSMCFSSRIALDDIRRHRFFWRSSALNVTGEKKSNRELRKEQESWIGSHNGERRRVLSNRRRARSIGLDGSLTDREWMLILDAFGGKCAYCLSEDYQVLEHVVPIALGGPTNKLNVVPACVSCNTRKFDHDPVECMGKDKIDSILARLKEIAK